MTSMISCAFYDVTNVHYDVIALIFYTDNVLISKLWYSLDYNTAIECKITGTLAMLQTQIHVNHRNVGAYCKVPIFKDLQIF